jgi:hypothetical protein
MAARVLSLERVRAFVLQIVAGDPLPVADTCVDRFMATYVLDLLEPSRWCVEHHERVASRAIASEVVVACASEERTRART